MKISNDKKIINRIMFIVLCAIYFLAAWFLYYNQLQYPQTGRFESDTAVHVSFAVEEHYYHSLAAFIYIVLSVLPFSDFTISFVLSLATVGSIVATYVLIDRIFKYYNEKIPEYLSLCISAFANFVMGFYIKAANRQHYIGYESPNMWHNSTYNFMRLFAILTIICFLTVFEKYKEGITVKQWLSFSVILAITTGFKASFLTVFAPCLALLLLADLIRGTKFKNVLILGTTVLPSILIMGIQSVVLAGESGSNGYIISPFTALSMRGDHPKATLVLSVLFPILIFAFHIKDFYKDKIYLYTLILWFVSFVEVFLLMESGDRELDGNFMWGYFISLFFLFLVSMIKMMRDFYFGKTTAAKRAYVILTVQGLVLLWHVFSGIWYFVLLLSGVTYFV